MNGVSGLFCLSYNYPKADREATVVYLMNPNFGLFGDFGDELLEDGGFLQGEVGHDFTIKTDFVVGQHLDELAVAGGILDATKRSVDTLDPEGLEIAFFQRPAGEGILACVEQGFVGSFEEPAVGHAKALGQI